MITSKEMRHIKQPIRYVGGEVNQIIKNSNNKTKVALCYPGVYEDGIIDYEMNMIYQNLNMIDNVSCTRCYAPMQDFEELLKRKQIKLYSLENREELINMDYLIFVIDDVLRYTTVLNMIDIAGIKLKKENRDSGSFPKIVIFSTNINNIKLMEPFIDLFYYNKDLYQNINNLAKLFCNGIIVKDYGDMIVPSMKIENYTIILDVGRENKEECLCKIEKGIIKQGIKKVSLTGIDYEKEQSLCELLYYIKTNSDDIRIVPYGIDFSKFSLEAIEFLKHFFEKTTMNFKLELRTIVIKEEKKEFIEKIKKIFNAGWNSINIEFCIGTPGETYEDMDEFFNILEEIINIYSMNKAKDKLNITAKLEDYIPERGEEIASFNKLEIKKKYIQDRKIDDILKIKIQPEEKQLIKTLLSTRRCKSIKCDL
ncbi:MAG: hypothetical protein PHD20_03140 [Clostridia bacterium]|nr:hypothetical protein [Clostridia bacterium]